jgi:uncharacterized OB-fold protein
MGEDKKQELIEVTELVSIPHKFSTGPVMGRFLSEIRDNKRIVANKCPKCGRIQLPPRIVCAECHCQVDEWVELAPRGEIRSYDVTFVPTLNPLTGKMREVPYTTASILLDGGDETLMHFLDVTDPKKLRVGMRCEAVFAPDGERQGRVTDIIYFRVIPE